MVHHNPFLTLEAQVGQKLLTWIRLIMICYIVPWWQGSGNFEIWIGPADDDDVINEPISKKKNVYITCHEN